MRILLTIPHYFNPETTGKHASQRRDPKPRIVALTSCLASLHQLFGPRQAMFDIARKLAVPVNQPQAHQLDIVVCTTQERHILAQLNAPANWYTHHATNAEPMLLGFECQAVLRERLGQYDYYGYLEDDLSVHDPWFFIKLAWFTRLIGNENLLQPNRFETTIRPPLFKAYVDGNLRPEVTARWQNVREQPVLEGRVMETPVRLVRALNPHAGCYFLNAEQMAHWARQPYFLDRDASFIGPLESAATLGIMRTFRVYKPAPEHASFLEVQHYGQQFVYLVERNLPLSEHFLDLSNLLPARGPVEIPGGSGVAGWEQLTGFFSTEEASAIQTAVKQLPPRAKIAELGCFQGRSAVAIASVLPAGGVLHCVDHFQGSLLKPGEVKPTPEEATRRNRGAFERNVETFGVKDRIELHVMSTNEAAGLFPAENFDLIFIDAGHQYEAVRADLANWYPKLKPGGWLFCDDYDPQWPGVIQAIMESNLGGQLAAPSLWCHRKPAAR